MRTTIRSLFLLVFALLPSGAVRGQQTNQPYIVEWGLQGEVGLSGRVLADLQKYQIATLNKEKELGGVLKYEVFRPGFTPAKIIAGIIAS
jgi:hypothetical protein